jgi:hypothetical protein
LAAAARYSRANPTWNDVRNSLNRLDNLSRRLHSLQKQISEFDMEVDALNDMLSVLMSALDKPRKLVIRQNANRFFRSAEIFMKLAETAPEARTPQQNDRLAESWGRRWEDIRNDLAALMDHVRNISD